MTKICLLHISTFSKSTFEPWLNWNDRTKSIFKSQKSEVIFLSCVRRVTNRGFKPLQCLSCHISRSTGWIRNWVDKSCCMWRGGLLQKQLDCVINALATGPLADCIESLRRKKLKTKCLVWCETCRQRSWHNMRGMKILLGVSWSTLAEFQPTSQSNKIGTIMMMEVWPLQIWSLRTQVVQTALQAENPSQMAVPLQNTLLLPLLGAALLPSQPTAENNNNGRNQRLQLLTAVGGARGGSKDVAPGAFLQISPEKVISHHFSAQGRARHAALDHRQHPSPVASLECSCLCWIFTAFSLSCCEKIGSLQALTLGLLLTACYGAQWWHCCDFWFLSRMFACWAI